jgi:hypothetical protein
MEAKIDSKTRTYKTRAEQEEHRASLICKLDEKRAKFETLTKAKNNAVRSMDVLVDRLEEQEATVEALKGN